MQVYETDRNRWLREDLAVCLACSCPTGWTEYFKIDNVKVPLALKQGFLVQSPPEIQRITVVRILEGSSMESNPEYLIPKVATVVIAVNNTVQWINEDTVPHTIVSDTGYKDPVSGPFDSLEQQENVPGGFLREGQTFEFTFTQPGEYGYHGEPHPWIQGTIIVLPAKLR